MIDKNLNFGRGHIRRFLRRSKPYRQVLDIGAGKGLDLKSALKIQRKVELHAVEIHAPYVRRLKRRKIKVHQINLECDRLPLDDEQFDIIIANQVFEHIKEIFWLFHEISRTLKTGGKLIVGVPNMAAWHNRLLLLLGRQPSSLKNVSAHVRGWTRRDLLNTLNTCFPGGYELKQFAGSNFYPFPPILAKPLASIFPNMAWSIMLHLEKSKNYNNEFLQYPTKRRLQTNFFTGGAIQKSTHHARNHVEIKVDPSVHQYHSIHTQRPLNST